MNNPAFVLLNPQMGENIGAVARAMSNFGLTDLRIVAPRDGWPNEAATAMAAHGAHIIETTMVADTLKEALADISTLYATTPRQDVLNKKVMTPREAMGQIFSSPCREEGVKRKTAILFGAERAGLSNEDIVLADGIISIPVSAENPSLNLAQAAVVIAYEWFLARHPGEGRDPCLPAPEKQIVSLNNHVDPGLRRDDSASKAELEGLFEHAKELLDRVNYFREPGKVKLMWQHLRSIWVRSELSSQEVRTLRGMIRSILRQMK